MIKKSITILLILMMIFSLNALGYGDNTKFTVLKELGSMNGDENGDLALDRYVSRAEYVKMVVALSEQRDSVSKMLKVSPYTDVSYNAWYAPYVFLAASNKYLSGYIDGTFRPDSNITYEEAITVIMRLLGFNDDQFMYSWPYGQVSTAESRGITNGVNCNIGDKVTRGDVSTMLFNMLDTNVANGTIKYISKLGFVLNEDVIILATHKSDSSVPDGYANTSIGTFAINYGFDENNVGSKGDLLIDNNTIIAFSSNSISKNTYNVYSVIGNSIMVYKNGTLSNLVLSSSDTAYFNGKPTTIGDIRNQLDIGYTIDITKNIDNSIDYITVSTAELNGPFVVNNSSWMSDYKIDNNAIIMRKGAKVSFSEVTTNDIIYYSQTLNTVWCYCDTVTGIYESATPNKDTPTSVTLSGKTYEIEGTDAYNALSSNGTIFFGDTVTLLLGKNNGAAGVALKNDSVTSITGYLVDCAMKEYTDNSGNKSTSNFISIIAADGKTYEYASAKDYSTYKYKVVLVTFDLGKANVTNAPSNAIDSGTFSYSTKTFSNYNLDNNIQILEVLTSNDTNATSTYAIVYPQRLDMCYIESNQIKYAEFNSENKLSKMIIDDITGDLYSYGIVVQAESTSSGMKINGTYTYFDGTVSKRITTNGSMFSVGAGMPVRIKNSNGSTPESLVKLTSKGVIKLLSDTKISIDGNTQDILSNTLVYVNNYDFNYYVTNFSSIADLEKDYILTAYIDKEFSTGGRIRVIVATKSLILK